MQKRVQPPFIAIACGGTGGHLFPGLAVAEELLRYGCEVALLISPKEVDQQAVKSVTGMQVITLPAVGLQNGRYWQFLRGFWQSYRAAKAVFKKRVPQAVLAMGGFTSAPPVLAAKGLGAATFLHESNTIPGRANRWLARFVNEAFVFFPETSRRLRLEEITATGMPVRSQFQPLAPAGCRMALGLDSRRPVVLVMGGSQGAQGVNELVVETLPLLADWPDFQYLHLTGANDVERVRAAYRARKLKAIVRPFLTEMELALGAASIAISRSGASSLAELAAMRLPAILVPYPAAVDNHQYHNALAFANAGAARLLEQKTATPEALKNLIVEMTGNEALRAAMAVALGKWHYPNSAALVAKRMFAVIGTPVTANQEEPGALLDADSGPAGDRLKRGAAA